MQGRESFNGSATQTVKEMSMKKRLYVCTVILLTHHACRCPLEKQRVRWS